MVAETGKVTSKISPEAPGILQAGQDPNPEGPSIAISAIGASDFLKGKIPGYVLVPKEVVVEEGGGIW